MSHTTVIHQVDAFTGQPFKGNPAGVCIIAEEIPEELMQNIAAEMNLSETAFVTPSGKEYQIRFFTPETEIPLCGHATLSSAHIIYETGITDKNETITFNSKSGKLPARTDGNWITMDFPSFPLETVTIPAGIEKLIGIRPVELLRTGHGWSFALLKNETEVRDLKPDFRIMRNSDYGDLIVTAPSDDPQYDFCVRCFAPALGIDEDPVTGSAQCVLVPFWHGKTGRKEFMSHQVSKRGGILKAALKGSRVEISGQARTIIRGELLI
ncbi:MAG: PhzF family phenazine biosynthesis protein [Bacteroidales bacterium]|nr:PhzF family phenazine biosynthesis protein [Bacteroidales bacterium]